jgi:hypothetical protein
MTRTPTTTDTTVEWQERVTDPDSGSLTLSLTLDAVDDGSGFTNDGTDSGNLSWLSFTKTTNTLNDGTFEALVDIVANKSGLQQGYTYRFKITADDGTTAVDRTFTLSIERPPIQQGITAFVFNGDSGGLEKTSPDHSTSPTQITATSNADQNDMIAYDFENNTIFWEDANGNIYKIKPDGSGETQIASSVDSNVLTAGNGYVFAGVGSSGYIYRYNQDGTNQTQIANFGTYMDNLAYDPDSDLLFVYVDGTFYAKDDAGNTQYSNNYLVWNAVNHRVDLENRELYAVSDSDNSVLKVFDMDDLSFKRDVSTPAEIAIFNIDPINEWIYTIDDAVREIYRLNFDGSQVWQKASYAFSESAHIAIRNP